MTKPLHSTLAAMAIAFITICLLWACQTQHKVETVHKVEVAPMHITIDVNVKVDRALDDFFGDLDEAADEIKTAD